MANIPFKSITFPGLPNKYTVPEISSDLMTAGKAADAKATGDALSALEDVVTEETDKLKADLDDKIIKDAITYLELEWTQGKYINSSGALKTTSATTAYATADYIPVKAGATYYTNAYAQSNYHCALYDAQKNLVGSAWQNSAEYVFTPAVDGYVRLTTTSTYVDTTSAYLIQCINPESEILAVTQKKLSAALGFVDVNFIDTSKVVAGYDINAETGRLKRHAGYSASNFIPVIPGARYSLVDEGASWICIAFYSKALTFISAQTVSVGLGFVVPDNLSVEYARVSMYNFPNAPASRISNDGSGGGTIHSNNLLDATSIVTGKYIDTDGTEKTSSLDPPAAYTDYYISVEEGDVIAGTYGNNTAESNLYKVCAYDENKNVLSESGSSSTTAKSYTVPSGVAYIKVSARWFQYGFARLTKNGLNVKYQPYYVETVKHTAQQNYNNIGDVLRYPLTSLPGYILKNLAYKPLGQLSKAYLCLVSDDGKAELASYTIPMFISKGVPGTWAVMSQSEIFDTPEQTAVVVDSVENHGCEIAMHGLSNWDSYDEFFLNQYFDQQDAFLATKGLTAYGAVCPSHHINDTIRAVAGGRYGCLRTGFEYGSPYYDNYMNGARSNLFGLSCYGIPDGTLQTQKDHIDYAIAHNLLCIVFWHDHTLTTELKERLEALIDYAKTTNIEFITLKDVPTII